MVIKGLYSSENNVQQSFDTPVKVRTSCLFTLDLLCLRYLYLANTTFVNIKTEYNGAWLRNQSECRVLIGRG